MGRFSFRGTKSVVVPLPGREAISSRPTSRAPRARMLDDPWPSPLSDPPYEIPAHRRALSGYIGSGHLT